MNYLRLAHLLTVFLAVPLAGAELAECIPRGGLPHVFAKLSRGDTVRIAYLGGSITAQDGWRPKTLRWFRDQFPAAKVEEINAAIGGTGSDLGVFRLQHDVLAGGPDLVFVEFAVNDGGASPEQIHRCMEGIVRQTWRANPATDICYVYTLAGGMLDTLKAGHLPTSQVAMEQIAEHYHIPSINMGVEVARLEKAGRLVFKGEQPKTDSEKAAMGDRIVFSPDSVHPYPESGHQLYLEAIVRGMGLIRPLDQRGPHALGEPFTTDNLEAAKLLSLDRARLGSGWTKLAAATNRLVRSFGSRLPGLWRANQPGDAIEFRFKGTAVGIYDLLGPDCGQVNVILDGAPAVIRPRFDAYCTYHRLATLMVGQNLSNTTHSVRLTIHPEQPDKAAILRQRNEKIDDPKRFDDRAWYAGGILLVGEWVEGEPAR